MYVRLIALCISLVIFGFVSNIVSADTIPNNNGTENYLQKLPSDLKLKEEGPQKYRFVCDYLYVDLLGNLYRKQRVSGDYTRNLPDGKVKWNNVRIAEAKTFDDAFPEGTKQDYIEDFTYNFMDIPKPDFFKNFPQSAMETRNLVWDTIMLESLGWNYFDKLELNHTYIPSESQGEISLSGSGTFQNRQIELTWLGISKMNDELCALIQYRAFINKLNVAFENVSIKGRSHYWGEIWVSLKDKQIEHGTLYEDVIVEYKQTGQTGQLSDVFRIGTFEKLP
jgi:hypothetical protein